MTKRVHAQAYTISLCPLTKTQIGFIYRYLYMAVNHIHKQKSCHAKNITYSFYIYIK